MNINQRRYVVLAFLCMHSCIQVYRVSNNCQNTQKIGGNPACLELWVSDASYYELVCSREWVSEDEQGPMCVL